ncbi:MAG: T9SS type A sorting domain-containing protein [Saprospiraceae bacterium]
MKKIIIGLLLIHTLNSFSQQAIYATISGGDLYSFDLTNCTKQIIGSTGQNFADIALTPNGQLWGIFVGDLYRIDVTTASVTLIGNTGLGALSLVELNDTILLAEYGMKLYGINTNNATSHYIDTIGYKAYGDLTWYDNDLYMVTSGGQIIKMVLNNNNTSILSITPIGSSIPNCAGAVTASFVGDYNSIVGFNENDIIKICQIDGSTQTLCPNLIDVRTFGAASIRLVTQVPQPTTCGTTAFESISLDNSFLVFPNPVGSVLNIHTKLKKKIPFNIYNSFGQLVIKGVVHSDLTTISMDDLHSGFYTVELMTDNHYERIPFIVKK